MNALKDAFTSDRNINKVLGDFVQYTPPESIAKDAYGGNRLEEGDLDGVLDTTFRDIELIYLRVPNKNYQLVVSIHHFPVLGTLEDGAKVRAKVNQDGFISDIFPI